MEDGCTTGDQHTPLFIGKMPSTIIKEASEPLLTLRNPSTRLGSLDSGTSGAYNNKNNLRYDYCFVVCIGLLAVETAIWRKYIAPLCGSYCSIK